MFEDMFGTISPILIASLVTAVVKLIRDGYYELKNKELPRIDLQLVALGLNWIFGIPFHLSLVSEITWWTPIEGFLYSSILGFYSMGLWTVMKGRRNGQ